MLIIVQPTPEIYTYPLRNWQTVGRMLFQLFLLSADHIPVDTKTIAAESTTVSLCFAVALFFADNSADFTSIDFTPTHCPLRLPPPVLLMHSPQSLLNGEPNGKGMSLATLMPQCSRLLYHVMLAPSLAWQSHIETGLGFWILH